MGWLWLWDEPWWTSEKSPFVWVHVLQKSFRKKVQSLNHHIFSLKILLSPNVCGLTGLTPYFLGSHSVLGLCRCRHCYARAAFGQAGLLTRTRELWEAKWWNDPFTRFQKWSYFQRYNTSFTIWNEGTVLFFLGHPAKHAMYSGLLVSVSM